MKPTFKPSYLINLNPHVGRSLYLEPDHYCIHLKLGHPQLVFNQRVKNEGEMLNRIILKQKVQKMNSSTGN